MTVDPTIQPAPRHGWQPDNDVERSLAEALARGDTRGYFQVVSVAELLLPRVLADPAEAARLFSVDLFGHTFIPVFTSPQGVADVFGGLVDGCAVTNYAELRRKWPDPQWRLAINPGTPIDAYVRIEAVEAAALGEIEIPEVMGAVVADMRRDADQPVPPVPDSAPLLQAAADGVDVTRFLQVLVDSVLTVPTARPVQDPGELFEPTFPWVRKGSTIEVFTSPEAYRRLAGGTGPTLTAAAALVAMVWPPGCSLSLDPGAPHGIELTDEQVRTLALWDGDSGGEDPHGEDIHGKDTDGEDGR